MGKITKTAFSPSSYNMMSQTPKNFNTDNYYLQTLQDKVDADWDFRPNKVDVEEEQIRGSGEYQPLEVVIESVKNDKGEKLADDYRRLVFRDIRYVSKLGTKYRFNYNFDLDEEDDKKWIWLVTNKNTASPTSTVVITRCNNTIASTYKDVAGNNSIHYEPIINGTNLTDAGIKFDDAISVNQGDIKILVQYNEFSSKYYINQRFIVGPNQVFKVTAIQNTNSLSTFDVHDIGLIILSASLDQKSEFDDFETRLAFNKTEEIVNPSQPVIVGGKTFKITEPQPLPEELFNMPVTFKAGLYYADTLDITTPIGVECDLDVSGDPLRYFDLVIVDNNTFTLRRKKVINKKLTVKVYINDNTAGTAEEISQTFEIFLGGLE